MPQVLGVLTPLTEVIGSRTYLSSFPIALALWQLRTLLVVLLLGWVSALEDFAFLLIPTPQRLRRKAAWNA